MRRGLHSVYSFRALSYFLPRYFIIFFLFPVSPLIDHTLAEHSASQTDEHAKSGQANLKLGAVKYAAPSNVSTKYEHEEITKWKTEKESSERLRFFYVGNNRERAFKFA